MMDFFVAAVLVGGYGTLLLGRPHVPLGPFRYAYDLITVTAFFMSWILVTIQIRKGK